MSHNVDCVSSMSIPRKARCRPKRVDVDETLPKCARLNDSPTDACFINSPSPPVPHSATAVQQGPSQIGVYLLLPISDRNGAYRALDVHSGGESLCKVFSMKQYQEKILPYATLPAHQNISSIVDIIMGDCNVYVFFERDYGDIHTFVKGCKKVEEDMAARLYYQIVSAVAHCHHSGIVLGDLKLRKFIFSDKQRTLLKLESLEESHIVKEGDDSMSEKHGCPAYVSPEILNTAGTYSGKSADVWSLGVMLYTLLVGHYPFHDSDPSALFSKIRKGQFYIPETVSPKAKCLIRSILRREACERLTAAEILLHPWFREAMRRDCVREVFPTPDQTVPEVPSLQDDFCSFLC
ncbi:tribbles homolog 1 isoform X1 [Erpetoichthys calabaricus]|uniref:tribbles homolog 1 isoform X1 n=1 Tax=Erpetoichthys calabaricus TaxID=27687 RepID=UPI002234A7C4|nr:tribbles homolog 1 isoform X1 [Erpetoichthys calabaricus]